MSKKWVGIFCFIFLIITTVVWAKSDSAYIDNGNGTVTDIETRLMWQQATAGELSWYDAMSYGSGLSLAGHTDWRLPTLDELKTLIDSKWTPTIDPAYFPNTFPDFYWSSTFDTDNGPAWGVNFYGGYDATNYRYDGGYVRAVRYK